MADNSKEIEKYFKSETPEDLKSADFPLDIKNMIENENDQELKAF